MKLSISNIAWEPHDDAAIASLLIEQGLDAIDMAPTKYVPNIKQATSGDAHRIKSWWAERGFTIIGMQSLFYGTAGLNMFGRSDAQQAMLDHFAAVCAFAEGVGANRLTFGSPKNRDRAGLDDNDVMAVAVPFFQSMGAIAARHGVTVCLEPNPTLYSCNFVTTHAEALTIVRLVDHPSVRVQLDTGTITVNKEDLGTLWPDLAPMIGHIHLSEPSLETLGDGKTNHALMAQSINRLEQNTYGTIEMLPDKTGAAIDAVRRALVYAGKHYELQRHLR